MYLRKNNRFKDGKVHTYRSLMETVRTDEGPRQRLLCYLGELNNSRIRSWRKVIKVFNDKGEEEQLELFPSETPAEDPTGRNIVKVDLRSIRLERAREFGAVYLALEIWRRLKLDKFFSGTIDRIPSSIDGSRAIDIPLVKDCICSCHKQIM